VHLPIRVDYAARTVLDLGEHWGQGLIRSADIAHRQGIPETFLDQVLRELRRANIVRSVRGPRGGHELARTPASLTLGEVVVDALVQPPSIACMRDGECMVFDDCVLQDVWHDLAARYQQMLGAVTIEELIRHEATHNARHSYSI
jgi:Rrf2 family protein